MRSFLHDKILLVSLYSNTTTARTYSAYSLHFAQSYNMYAIKAAKAKIEILDHFISFQLISFCLSFSVGFASVTICII